MSRSIFWQFLGDYLDSGQHDFAANEYYLITMTLADLVRKMVMETDPVAIAAAHRGMAIRPDVTSLLPNLRFPTLVIVGEHDVISPPQEMRTIADAIPQARFVQIPAAGHLAPMENPAAVNRAISDFLQATR